MPTSSTSTEVSSVAAVVAAAADCQQSVVAVAVAVTEDAAGTVPVGRSDQRLWY